MEHMGLQTLVVPMALPLLNIQYYTETYVTLRHIRISNADNNKLQYIEAPLLEGRAASATCIFGSNSVTSITPSALVSPTDMSLEGISSELNVSDESLSKQ
jgi:hypothetical protein